MTLRSLGPDLNFLYSKNESSDTENLFFMSLGNKEMKIDPDGSEKWIRYQVNLKDYYNS